MAHTQNKTDAIEIKTEKSLLFEQRRRASTASKSKQKKLHAGMT
jgi:hypothetical protein